MRYPVQVTTEKKINKNNNKSRIYPNFNQVLHFDQLYAYNCNKITRTWIQISRQNWNGFFSNANHQIMI